MQDAKSFIARVDATRAILAATAGRPGHEGVVDNERAELLLLLGGITVRGQDAAAVIAAIKGAALPGNLEEVLITRLCEMLSAQPTCSQPQAKMPPWASRGGSNNQGCVYQDFTAIVNYIPEGVWSYARENQNASYILQTAVALGLRRGNEATYKTLWLCMIASMKGLEFVSNMPPSQRTDMMRTIKPQVLEYSGLLGSPAIWLGTLPAEPAELKAAHPDFYASVYTNAEPAPNPFEPLAWRMLLTNTKCRRDRSRTLDCHNNLVSTSPSSYRASEPGVAYLLQKIDQLQQDLRGQGQRAFQDDLQITFPTRSGLIKGDTGTLSLRGQASNLPALPPPTAIDLGEKAAAPNDVKPRRLSVAETTASLLEKLTTGKAKGGPVVKAGGEDTPPTKRKKKKKKKKAPACEPAPKPEKKKPPVILYKELKDKFTCYYNKLGVKSYHFKTKKQKRASQKNAEDICGKFHYGFLGTGARPMKRAILTNEFSEVSGNHFLK